MIFLLLFASFGQNLPDGPGKDAVLQICQDCPELDGITADNMTREGWKKRVAKMGERGAEGTDEKFAAIVEYLAKYFGRINVNKASAEEIAAGLKFSPK